MRHLPNPLKCIAFLLLLLPAIALARVSPSPGGAVKVTGLNTADRLQQGLVLDLPLDASTTIVGADTTAADFSGYGYDGDVYGAVATTDGMTFDGTQWVEIATRPDCVTESFWVKSPTISTAAILLANFRVATYCTFMGSDGKIYYYSNSAGATIKTVSEYDDNTWHHIVISGDVIYVDGVAVATEAGSSFLSTKTLIGARYSGSYERFFIGSIKDFKIYNRALSPASVTALYNERQKVHSSNNDVLDTVDVNINDPYSRSAAYYPLGKNVTIADTDTLTYDFSSSDNPGDVYGATTGEDRFGNPDGAAVFDGTQWIKSTSSISDIGDAFMLSAWVYPTNITSSKTIVETRNFTDGTGGAEIRMIAGVINFVQSGLAILATAPSTLALNTWQHVAVVNSDSARVYIDGVYVVGNAAGSGFNHGTVMIGALTDIPTQNFIGSIDDTLILPYAASSTTISELANDRSKVHMSPEGRVEVTSIIINP